MGDTPQSFRLTKDGNEARQDQEIHYLRDQLELSRTENVAAHAEIVEKLHTFSNLQAVLKVLGVLVLALIGSVVGFIAAGASWISSVEEHLHRVELKGMSDAKEGFAIARSLQKEVNALQVAVVECQRRHGIRPDKE